MTWSHECPAENGDIGCVNGKSWFANHDFGALMGPCDCGCHTAGSALWFQVQDERKQIADENAEDDSFIQAVDSGRYA